MFSTKKENNFRLLRSFQKHFINQQGFFLFAIENKESRLKDHLVKKLVTFFQCIVKAKK